jgi:V/A-type H+-transporting ATPase subunit D
VNPEIHPTRSELLHIRKRKQVVEKAHLVLRKKQDAIILLIQSLLKDARKQREYISEQFRATTDLLAVASMMEGETGLAIAAASVEENPLVSVHKLTFMGVRFCSYHPVNVIKNLEERGYGILGTSSVVDELADAYEELLCRIIKAAEYESKLKALLSDLERTRRLVKGIELRVIPELVQKEEWIRNAREEREREDLSRLLHIKKKKRKWRE